MACQLLVPVNGISVSEVNGQCVVQADAGILGPGVYDVTLRQTNDTTGAVIADTPFRVTVPTVGSSTQVYYSITPLDECLSDISCFVDEDGLPYQTGGDVDGNPCIVIPRNNPLPSSYTTADGIESIAADCVSDQQAGRAAYNATSECVTHVCGGAAIGWMEVCGVADVETAEACYDLANAVFPLCLGGGQGSWTIPTGTVLDDITCTGDDTLTDINRPASPISWSCDFSSKGTEAMPSNIAALSWTAATTSDISATGFSADGWACTAPTFRAEFGFPADVEGTFTATFSMRESSGFVNLALYDPANNVLVPVTTATDDDGWVSIGGSGDIVTIDERRGNPASPINNFTVTWNGTGVDGEQVQIIATGVGRDTDDTDPDPIEINNLTIDATLRTTATTDCCTCYSDLATVAAAMTANDPAGNTWAVNGTKICAQVTAGTVAAYGDLCFCNNVCFPEGEAIPPLPQFTAQPSDQCLATVANICASCQDGTIVGYRYRVAGGQWVTVTTTTPEL